jgi:folate-binding protein YgfZ
MSQHNSYQLARTAAAIVDRSARGWVVVSGADRRSYLHGLLTNDIASLQAGQGCYAAYLTPQGRMIADLWVYELGDVLLVSMIRDVKPTVLARLDQFIFTEDVQLGDVSDTFAATAVIGPRAAEAIAVAAAAAVEPLTTLPEHGNVRIVFEGQPAIVLSTTDTGERGYDVLVAAGQAARLRERLHAAGAVDVDERVAEALRLEAAIPLFHRDMDEETIPLEAGIESRAISMTKGCYVGQEVIVRVLHRGHGRVARRLVGLTVNATAPPPAGASVQADGREVGSVTSSAMSPAIGKPIALAYVHRDFVAAGTTVRVNDSDAVVTPTPFVRPKAAVH